MPVVNLKANAVLLDESGASGEGVFRLVRTGGDPTQPVVVNLQIKGSAQVGTDYSINHVTTGEKTIVKSIRMDRSKKKIHVIPQDLGIANGALRGVKMVLLPGTGYTVGPQAVAHVKILQDR